MVATQTIFGAALPMLLSVILYQARWYRRWCRAVMFGPGRRMLPVPPLLMLGAFLGMLVVDWGAAFDWVAAAMVAWAVSGGAGLLWLGAYNAGRRDSYIEETATLVMTAVLVSGGLVAAVVWNLAG